MKLSTRLRIRSAAAACLCMLCFVLFASCDESLPPRDEPQNFLVASTNAFYYNAHGADFFYLTVFIRNNYTETFSDTAAIFGTITLQWKEDPSFQRHFDLTGADLKKSYFDPITKGTSTAQSDFSPISKILTIPENGYTVFQVLWDLRSDNHQNIKDYLKFYTDPLSSEFDRTGDMTFVVNSGIHLYKNISSIYSQPMLYHVHLLRKRF
jgi:hypothetical protein